jgi:hypothetical protein
LDYIGQQLDNGKQTDIIYLDMSKAFDRVRHDVLLANYNILILGETSILGSLLVYPDGNNMLLFLAVLHLPSQLLQAYLKVLFLDLYYSFSTLMIYMILSSLPFPVLLMILNYLKLLTTKRT